MIRYILLLLVFVTNFTYAVEKMQVIAHRGGAILAPENTMAAFKKAIEVRADYFELDVFFSSDDSIMVMHDQTLDRTTTGSGKIELMTYNQLRQFDAGSKFSPAFKDEKIPTLWEALSLAKNSANNIQVVIEIKTSNPNMPGQVVAMVKKMNLQKRVIVAAFSFAAISEVKKLDSSIRVMHFVSPATTASINSLKSIGGEWLGAGGTCTKEMVDYAHANGIYYNRWTINGISDMQSSISLGVDAITTDDPKTLISVMDQTPPTNVVLSTAEVSETDVVLKWEAAQDMESGVAGYNIYRGEKAGATVFLAKTRNVTEYVDKTNASSKTYYYRVKAFNPSGLISVDYSNEISATTTNDITAPKITHVTSKGTGNTIVIGFNEMIDQTSAETIQNYSVNNNITIEKAELSADQHSVILTTSKLSAQSYKLNVKNIKDKSASANVMAAVSLEFKHSNIKEGAVAIYTLDSFSKQNNEDYIMDETSNNNDAKVKNGVQLSAGVLGNGIKFDGVDDYVQISSSPSLNINTNAVTVSLWVNMAYLPSELPVSYGPVFDSDGDQYVLYADKANNELRFKVTTSNGAERPGIKSSDLVAGEWVHIAGVYDGNNAMIYLNGEKKDSHALTGTVAANQIAYLARNGSSTTYFKGSMDQIEIYNRALTGEEILNNYQNCKDKAVVVNTTSTEKLTEQSELIIYPNPTEGKLNIRIPDGFNKHCLVRIFDISGRLMHEKATANTSLYTTNLKAYPKGVYIVEIANDVRKYNRQIIKK